MDFRHLRFFVAVAEELNFTHAAERLHTVQPSLSRQIRQLEEIVGTPLFHRGKRDVKLSEAGEVFLEKSRAMLQDLDRAIQLARQAAQNQAGQITIGFIPGTEMRVFMVLLPVLRQKFPQVHPVFRTLLSEPDILAGLKNRTLNAAFLNTDNIVDQEIASKVILRQPLFVALPAKHRLSRLKRIPVAKLATVPLVRPDPAAEPYLVRIINSLADKHGVKFAVAMDMDNVLASLNAVSSGTGFTLLPEDYRHIIPDNVVMRPLDDDSPPILEMHVAYRKDNRLPALACFLELVQEHLTFRSPRSTPPT